MVGTIRLCMTRAGLACAAALLLAAVLPGADAAASLDAPAVESVEVIAEGLNSPRGLDVAPNGAVFVAEAGRGGSGPCVPGAGPGTEVCLGLTGAVTKVEPDGNQRRIVRRLPSLADEAGMDAAGPSDVIWSKNSRLYAVIGAAVTEGERDYLGSDADLLGRLVTLRRLNRPGFPDLVAFEEVNNPDGANVDSNPVSALRDGGNDFVIADAGANALFHFERRERELSTLAVLPPRDIGGGFPSQAVPTSVVKGPDGAYYVGQLTGFPFTAGEARVYRVVPGEDPTVYAEGFSTIIDLAFDSEGHLWVLEIAKDGLFAGPSSALVHVASDGTQTEVLTEGLVWASGLAIGDDDTVYISNCGNCGPNAGQVLKVQLSD